MTGNEQFGRYCNLIVATAGGDGIDLSQLRIRFKVNAADEEQPNTLEARIYNLSDATVRALLSQSPVAYTRVMLQAGYESAGYGAIFDGTIKQFRRGRENATDKYLDILAAEGDAEYTFGFTSGTQAAGTTAMQRAAAVLGDMGLKVGSFPAEFSTGGTLPRGKVRWGFGRAMMRNLAHTVGTSWSISGGKVNAIPLDGYLPGEAVVLTSATGLIGIPQQTEEGIKLRCLINPRIRVGGLVKLDNASINQTLQADLRGDPLFKAASLPFGQVPYDRRAGTPQFIANTDPDGLYRVYVIEYTGDTRGREWYADMICLAVDPSTGKVKKYG